MVAKKIENKVGAGISPYLTPLSIDIGSERDSLKLKQAFMFECSPRNKLTNRVGQPSLPRIIHNAGHLPYQRL